MEDVKREAYNNLDQLVLLNEQSFVGPPMLLSSLQAEHFSSPSLGLPNFSTPVADQGIQAIEVYFSCLCKPERPSYDL